MTAHIVRDVISNDIAMACEECGTVGEFLENRDGNRVVVNNQVTLHNSAQHWENPLKPFQPAILTTTDYNGHTPTVASLIIRRHPNSEISAECGGAECAWNTIAQTNDEDGWKQLNTWYSVHLTKEHGATPEQAFGVDHGTYDYHGHTPHMVTGQDFTESPQGEGENHALKILSDALRVKNM